MPSFVLSVLGDDRSGLVEALSAVVVDHRGNWEKSHMTQLAGKFAGVVLITVPDEQAGAFLEDLQPLESKGLLDITIEEAGVAAHPPASHVTLEVMGNDHPGIVHDLSHLLASHRVSIDELETWTSEAPMVGGTLFHASVVCHLPPGVSIGDVVGELEALAADLMVDVEVHTEAEDDRVE